MMTNRVHCLSDSSFLVFRQCLWSHLKIVLIILPKNAAQWLQSRLELGQLYPESAAHKQLHVEQEQLKIKLTSNKNNKREGEKKNVQTFNVRDLFQLSTKSCDLMSCQLMKLWYGWPVCLLVNKQTHFLLNTSNFWALKLSHTRVWDNDAERSPI